MDRPGRVSLVKLTLILLSCIPVICAGCGNSVAPPPGDPPTATGPAGALPGPGSFPDDRSAAQVFNRTGNDYVLAGGSMNPADGGGIRLTSRTGQTSWVVYRLSPGPAATGLQLDLSVDGSGWLGLADNTTGAWDFTGLDAATTQPVILDTAAHLSPGGHVMVAAVVHDTGWLELSAMSLLTAEELPVARINALQQNGLAPLTVNLSAFGSAGPTGITSYRFDLDGDGVFEVDATDTGGYADHVYDIPGEYTARLRVEDADGLAAEDEVTITVRDPADLNVPYDYVFDDSQVRRIDIAVARDDWDQLWVWQSNLVVVEATANMYGEELPSPIGFRMKGHLTLHASDLKKSWKLDFNYYDTEQTFHGLGSVMLNNNFSDASQCREKLSYDLMRQAGVPGNRVSYVELYIDIGGAGPEYWGLYSQVERIDKKFLRNRFPDNDGNLYEGMYRADLAWYGEDLMAYFYRDTFRYQRIRGEGVNDMADLLDMLDVLNNTPAEQLATELPAVLDAGSFLRFEAVNKFICSIDDYSCCNRNFYLYHEPVSGQFKFIPYDFNMSFGGFKGEDAVVAPLYEPLEKNFGDLVCPLFTRLMESPEYRLEYAGYLDLVRRKVCAAEAVRTRAKHWHDLIAPYVALEDKVDIFDYDHFDVNWDEDIVVVYPGGGTKLHYGIGNLASIREAYVDEHLQADL